MMSGVIAAYASCSNAFRPSLCIDKADEPGGCGVGALESIYRAGGLSGVGVYEWDFSGDLSTCSICATDGFESRLSSSSFSESRDYYDFLESFFATFAIILVCFLTIQFLKAFYFSSKSFISSKKRCISFYVSIPLNSLSSTFLESCLNFFSKSSQEVLHFLTEYFISWFALSTSWIQS